MDVGRMFPSVPIKNWNSAVAGSRLQIIKDGLTSVTAGQSAAQIKADTGTNTDGVYWIDLPTVGPTQIYCIMNSAYDGGGWMMTMKATRGSTFTYSSSYWTSINTLNTTSNDNSDADAKFNSFNYYAGKDLMAVFPDIGNGGSISATTRGWTWLQNNFYSGSSTTLTNFFNTGQRYISNPSSFSGFGSPWSTQDGMRWYGFNYTENGSNPVRWGFAWNNEGDHGSNDVTGGIGVGRPGYSAGDAIYCCQVQTGINRSARVEMYIR